MELVLGNWANFQLHVLHATENQLHKTVAKCQISSSEMVKINAQLETSKVLEVEQLLKEFKDVSAWTYKDLKGIPPKPT